MSDRLNTRSLRDNTVRWGHQQLEMQPVPGQSMTTGWSLVTPLHAHCGLNWELAARSPTASTVPGLVGKARDSKVRPAVAASTGQCLLSGWLGTKAVLLSFVLPPPRPHKGQGGPARGLCSGSLHSLRRVRCIFEAKLRADNRCDVMICYPEGIWFLSFLGNKS